MWLSSFSEWLQTICFSEQKSSSLLLTQAPIFLLTICVFSSCSAVHLPMSILQSPTTTPDILVKFVSLDGLAYGFSLLLPIFLLEKVYLKKQTLLLRILTIEFPTFTYTWLHLSVKVNIPVLQINTLAYKILHTPRISVEVGFCWCWFC